MFMFYAFSSFPQGIKTLSFKLAYNHVLFMFVRSLFCFVLLRCVLLCFLFCFVLFCFSFLSAIWNHRSQDCKRILEVMCRRYSWRPSVLGWLVKIVQQSSLRPELYDFSQTTDVPINESWLNWRHSCVLGITVVGHGLHINIKIYIYVSLHGSVDRQTSSGLRNEDII